MAKAQMPYPLLLVRWADASRLANSWMDLSDVPDAYLHKVTSVGFLISETQAGIILVPTLADLEHPTNTHAYGGMLIPSSSILSRKQLAAGAI